MSLFRRPFKIKSQTHLKSSERKQFREKILQKFRITDVELESLFPTKDPIVLSRLFTHSEVDVIAYCNAQRRPMFFELAGRIYPTVLLLWQLPHIVTTITTCEFVLQKIYGGADLMMPGVIFRADVTCTFGANEVAAVNINTNLAPVAVGVTVVAGGSNLLSMPGKCLRVFHTATDHLCTLNGHSRLAPPIIPPPAAAKLIDKRDPLSPEEFPSLGALSVRDSDNNRLAAGRPAENHPNSSTTTAVADNTEPVQSNEAVSTPPSDTLSEPQPSSPDEVFRTLFLTACKYSTTIELPMLTSAFYKTQVLAMWKDSSCQPDIKKTSYKKVGQFLKAMETEGLIKIVEKKKGVDMIEQIYLQHPTFRDFYLKAADRPARPDESKPGATKVYCTYAVTARTLKIFECKSHKIGDTLSPAEIRSVVTEYVRINHLQDPVDSKFVLTTTPCLVSLCKYDNRITWTELMAAVLGAMKPFHQFVDGGGSPAPGFSMAPRIQSGAPRPVTMVIQKRAANKKVTVVDNIDGFNIPPAEFCKELQHGSAASASVVHAPQGGNQVQVQGNQINVVYKLLTEKYRVPKHFIRGLEFAPKAKK